MEVTNYKISFLISVMLCSISCKNNYTKKFDNEINATTIYIGKSIGIGRKVNISEIAYNIKYIPLETNKNSIIGKGALAFYENGRIYIKFSKKVKVFNSDGNYLFTFNRSGRGPQEYSENGYIEIEKRTGNFNVQDFKGDRISLKKYNSEGVFKSEIVFKIPKNQIVTRVEQISDSSFLMKASPLIKRDNVEYFAYIIDSLSNVKSFISVPPTNKKDEKEGIEVGNRKINLIHSSFAPIIYTYKDSLRICSPRNNVIYSYDSRKGISPKYIFNYEVFKKNRQFNFTSGNLAESIQSDINYYIETDNFLLQYFYLGEYAHEPYVGRRWISFDKVKERRDAFGIFYKKTGEFTLLNQPIKGLPGFCDDFLNGPPITLQYVSGDNIGVQLVSSGELKDFVLKHNISGQLRGIVDGIGDEENPVIVLVLLNN